MYYFHFCLLLFVFMLSLPSVLKIRLLCLLFLLFLVFLPLFILYSSDSLHLSISFFLLFSLAFFFFILFLLILYLLLTVWYLHFVSFVTFLAFHPELFHSLSCFLNRISFPHYCLLTKTKRPPSFELIPKYGNKDVWEGKRKNESRRMTIKKWTRK